MAPHRQKKKEEGEKKDPNREKTGTLTTTNTS